MEITSEDRLCQPDITVYLSWVYVAGWLAQREKTWLLQNKKTGDVIRQMSIKNQTNTSPQNMLIKV